MQKILIVEDDRAIANLIKVSLAAEGYSCVCAYDGAEGADLVERDDFDLVILDIMLPEIDGYELFEYIKPMKIPTIFLTAKSAVNDRIRGLRLGADDYITKPFQVGELTARVEAVLRRYGKAGCVLHADDVEVDIDSRVVYKAGREVELTPKEFDLLSELVRNKNVAMYREALYEKVWGGEYQDSSRTLDAHIRRLRKKLGWEDRIKTVFRIGYRLEAGE